MELYLLYQTDVWKSHSSYVCFGLFESYDEALEEAIKNNLHSNPDEYIEGCAIEGIVIRPVTLGKFGEIV